MKKLKFLVLVIILAFIGLFIYQNIDYFMTKTVVKTNLYFYQWESPSLPVLLYWGICFGLGLLITGIWGLTRSFILGRDLKKKKEAIKDLEIQVKELQTRVEDLTRGPCIQGAVITPPPASAAEADKKVIPSPDLSAQKPENKEKRPQDTVGSSGEDAKKD